MAMTDLQTDATLLTILKRTKVIALVGWSPNEDRPSHRVARYLTEQGHRVIPVNPGVAGQVVAGETVRAQLSDIDEKVDMIDIFRKSEDVLPIVEDMLAHLPTVKTVWMQLGVSHQAAADLALCTWGGCGEKSLPCHRNSKASGLWPHALGHLAPREAFSVRPDWWVRVASSASTSASVMSRDASITKRW